MRITRRLITVSLSLTGMAGSPDVLPRYVCTLRVYEPLEAFGDTEAARWKEMVAAGAPDPADAERSQAVAAARCLLTRKLPLDRQELRQADTARADGALRFSPWSLRVQMAQAALLAADELPRPVGTLAVPEPLLEESRAELSRWRSASSDPRLHQMHSAFSVPIRWFTLVSDDERELWVDDDGPHLRYRTEISAARRRVARAVSVLTKAMGGDSEVTASVEALARWLEEFHAHSLVELDYGGVARLPGAEALENDHSAEDIAGILRSMADGEVDRAGELYQALTDRWRGIHIAERGN